VQLLHNGSFEAGLAPWQWQTNRGPADPSTTDWASEGIHSARLGNGNDRFDILEQRPGIPAEATCLTLEYDLFVEGPGDGGDHFYAEVTEPGGGAVVVNWHDGGQTGVSSHSLNLAAWLGTEIDGIRRRLSGARP
jgi:hypothetical protein